jgi:hypothetical protein
MMNIKPTLLRATKAFGIFESALRTISKKNGVPKFG